MSKLNNNSYFLKLLIIGDIKVGKTALIKKFCENKFTDKYYPTIGIDYGVKKIEFKEFSYCINIFDLSGDDEYKEVRKNFYKNVQICIICYNVTKPESIKNLNSWESEILKYSNNQNIEFFIVGCKNDKESKDIKNLGNDFASKRKYPHFITSSITSFNIDKLFNSIFEKINKKIKNNIF